VSRKVPGPRWVVLVLSAVVLALEVAHVRLLSYVTDPRLVYGAISVALAGLGGASMIVAIRPSLARGDERELARRVAICAIACGLSIVLSAIVLARVSRGFSVASTTHVLTRALPILVVCAIPYVPGGLAITIALASDRSSSTHRTYAASLIGSALGCFVPLALLRPLGLEALLSVLALACGACAWFMTARIDVERTVKLASVGTTIACAIAGLVAPRLMPFSPDPRDLLGLATASYVRTHAGTPSSFRPTRDHAAWDPVSRVEVWTFPGDFGMLNGQVPIKLVTQDGGAGTILIAFGPPPQNPIARSAWADQSVYGTGYFVAPSPRRVLVIGLGGGVDVVTALHHGAKEVTGVEINGSIVDVSKNAFGSFQSDVLSRPDVRVVHGDGRSFVESAQRRGERWSLIQMSGADTYSAGTAGAFMFSESYLYTVDAFERYLRALEDDGVLALIRFGPEGLRTVVSEMIALQRLGVNDPLRHFIVLRQGICYGIVVSRKPLEESQIARTIHAVLRSTTHARPSLPMWDAMGFGIDEPLRLEYAPGLTRGSIYQAVLEGFETGGRQRVDEILARMALDYSPTTDDRPFFFQFLRPRDWSRLSEIARSENHFLAEGLVGYVRLLVGFLVLAFAIALAPPLFARGRSRFPRGTVAMTAYFAALGIAYMLVELVIVQRTVLLLGHPSISVAVTLASLLLGSGIGSAYFGQARFAGRPARTVALAALAIVIGLSTMELVARPFANALLPMSLAVRVIALVLLVAPIGVAMGVPFPLGLAVARGSHGEASEDSGRALVAWGLGVNGFSSVLASLLAVPGAMISGFHSVMMIAIGLYAFAGVLGAIRFIAARRENTG